jgi:two-component system response regulator FixJ
MAGADVMEPIVYVIENNAADRESITKLIAIRGLCAHGFASAEEFLAQHEPTHHGCAVVNMRLPGMSGLELLQELRARRNSLPVVATAHDAGVRTAVQAMQAGAVTFVESDRQEEELWDGIKQALDVDKARHAQRKLRAQIEARIAKLTEDEMSVLKRLLEGHPNKRIATDLDIGLRTVELRRSNIMHKVQATSLPDLVRMALLVGIIKADLP